MFSSIQHPRWFARFQLDPGPVATVSSESDGFEEMVAATAQGSTMKLSWEGFAVSDSPKLNTLSRHVLRSWMKVVMKC